MSAVDDGAVMSVRLLAAPIFVRFGVTNCAVAWPEFAMRIMTVTRWPTDTGVVTGTYDMAREGGVCMSTVFPDASPLTIGPLYALPVNQTWPAAVAENVHVNVR